MRSVMRYLAPAVLICFVGALSVWGGLLPFPNLDSLLASIGLGNSSQPAPLAIASPRPAPAAPAPIRESKPEASPAQPANVGPASPAKDVAIEVGRIDPGGASVIAGRAPAGSRVTVNANGEPVAVVTASDDGQWSAVVTKSFPPGNLDLSVTADGAATTTTGSHQLTVAVPEGKGLVELATAPSKPRPIPTPRETKGVSELAALVERARASNGRDADAGRAVTPIVPVPITFVTGETTMTQQGQLAAGLLVEYIRITAPKTITLSGHADERGTDEFNLDLSRKRLEAIERHLRAHGYAGKLSLQPKGKSEPYAAIDRRSLSADAVLQADRRVELRLVE